MVFPADPRDVLTEVYVSSQWVDISADVLAREAVSLWRGRRNEAGGPESSRANLNLDNTAGNYSQYNPTGTYYGSLGRNTPLRLGIRPGISDTFTRTVSNGWGSATTGQAWSSTGAGGSVLTSDFAVTGSAGTHSVPAVSAYRFSYLSTVSYRDIEVTADVSLSFTDVTGGDVEPGNILLRGQSTTNYYMVRVVVTTAEAVTIKLMHYDGTEIAAAVTVSGLTHSSSQTLRVKGQVEGQTLRAKVWAASGSEPYDWHVTGHSELIDSAGWIGIRNGVAAGNSNAKPIVFSIDNITTRIPRFTGEVTAWPSRWDPSGRYRHVPLQSQGIVRRLSQGASALQSTLRRGMLASSNVVAYWPCEDGASATVLASALGGPAIAFTPGAIDLATYADFDASAPIPEFTTASDTWYGHVPGYTGTGNIQLRFLMHVPTAGLTNGAFLAALYVTGTAGLWRIKYHTGGSLSLLASTNEGGTSLLDTGAVAFVVDGKKLQVSLDLQQSGSNVSYALSTLEVGQSTGGFTSGSLASRTVSQAVEVRISPPTDAPPAPALDGLAVGHIAVRSAVVSIFDLYRELNAWIGETAGDRLARLCDQEGVDFSYSGDLTTTAAMGPQLPETLLELLTECVTADMGVLSEPRGTLGLSYRTLGSLYNQTATVGLDYDANQTSPPFEPTDDDFPVRNDVTAKRTDGSEARSVLETGRMSVLAPDQGGVGRYDTSVTVNVERDGQLPDIASWLRHLGTVDEQRYPAVTIELARSEVVAATLEPATLALDMGDRLTVDDLPTDQPADQVSQLVVGCEERISRFEHRFTVITTPERPYRILTLDDSSYGRGDSDTSTLASGITSTATSLSVAIADGTLWTTTGVPFDIVIGGETMTATAISGGSSPQTFTVTRSVNGVVKAHSAGASVHLATPVYLGL